jgi:hypothetical protein
MRNMEKCKKGKVPKLSEEEYAAYITSLKTAEESGKPTACKITETVEETKPKKE